MDQATRHCNACKATKPIAEFYPSYKARCRSCLKAQALLRRDEKLEYQRLWRAKNPDRFREWSANNVERRAANWRRWYEENKERRARSYSVWSRENRAIMNAKDMRRLAAKKLAIPPWADLNAIKAVYAKAAQMRDETGRPYEVDHIYPLQSKLVCGLHCEANLQILTKAANQAKRNKMPDLPEAVA